MTVVMGSTIQRQRLHIQGIVQGVGFRPFIYSQAHRLGLTGFVRNDSQGVTLEVEGSSEALIDFQHALREELPPLARITSLSMEVLPLLHEKGFAILQSEKRAERSALISPDTATCADCLRELFDPSDRRFHYPFINCTNCGPRFTIVQDVPYDRAMTTMSVFPMCPACRAEYDDPGNRRFHAQPNACPVCGPQISVLIWDDMGEAQPVPLASDEALRAAARLLAEGAVLAIKGLGGYHLACDALNTDAVHHLRQRKHRAAKPFALMARDLATVQRLCQVSADEAALLQAYRRPIVLLAQQPDCPVAPDVAPASKTLGMMLPYTPLHHVLLQHFSAIIPAGRPTVLVMTSGNLSDEPIAYRDDDAALRLQTIAEGMVMHNRAIHMRCDDSVVRVVAGGEQIFRRSRGYAPEPLQLTFDLPAPLLACGGHLKNTFCLGKDRRAFLSHHIGDLENLATLASFREGIEHFQRLFAITPEVIVHDLHPEYLATKYALDSDIALKIGVQHHHAHIASVLAEYGLRGPVIGVAADGTGYGTDGALWGCEILAADLCSFERLAHLAYVPLSGGEQAVRQPWRMAATYLAQTYGEAFLDLDVPFVQHLDRATWRTLAQMNERGLNSPLTSSLGRLFDAVAALLGVRSEIVYEGQAAIELETLAQAACEAGLGRRECYPFHIGEQTPALLDVRPIMRAIVEDLQRHTPIAAIAWRFHRTLAALLACACLDARRRTGLRQVALSGGVFLNRLLLELLCERLNELEFEVFINRRVPPNDGGLSFGQLAVAAARLRQG